MIALIEFYEPPEDVVDEFVFFFERVGVLLLLLLVLLTIRSELIDTKNLYCDGLPLSDGVDKRAVSFSHIIPNCKFEEFSNFLIETV